jgi:TRAP-type C4-dicarboxylate transport system permease large subunit
MGRSVGDMYLGATIPSIIQLALFALWVFLLSMIRPQDVPALPPEARTLRGKALLVKAAWGIIPSMVLIFLVLGTMALGLATPTEAGAMGAVGSIILAVLRGTYSNKLMYEGMGSTMRITAMVVMILIGSRVFSLVFNGVGGGEWIEGLLKGLPGGQTGFLIFTMVFIFIVAFFLDFFEIAFIIIPLLLPAATKLGIDPIWFGVLICANIQTSFMHPPFGFALFYLRGIAPPEIKSSDIYWGAIPWIVLQLILVAIIIAWPGSVTMMLDRGPKVDPSKVEIIIPQQPGGSPFGGSPFGGTSPFGTPPPFGAPPPIGGSGPPAAPNPFGGPPPGLSPPPGLTPPPVITPPAVPSPAAVQPPPPAPPPADPPKAEAPPAAPTPAAAQPAPAPAPAADPPKASEPAAMPPPAPSEPPKLGDPPKQ